MKLKLKDVPDDVLDDVAFQLKNYLVPICGLSPLSTNHPFRFTGSGTLVRIDNAHCILTAAHVWTETRSMDEIGLVLTDHPSQFKIPNAVKVKLAWDGKISEWGPDLALLELPSSVVPTIEAYKSFLNLVQQKEMLAAEALSDKVPWVVTGMVGEFSKFAHHSDKRIVTATAEARALFSGLDQISQKNGYDYLDLIADLGLSEVPRSFEGVSGGGLWQIGLYRDKSERIAWDGKRYFRGVAFWQTEVSVGQRRIRCHGPQSVYEKAWGLWKLPKSDE